MHSSVAIFNIEDVQIGVVLTTLAFMVVYELSSGPVTTLYTFETTIDAGLGLIHVTLHFTLFIMSLATPLMIDPKLLGPSPSFFILSGMSMVCFLYVLIFMKETFGKTDKEKKQLYTPDKYKNEVYL